MVQLNTTPKSAFATQTLKVPCFNWSTDFHSASELATAMKWLGKDFNVLQLTRGRLEGHFSVVHLSGLSIFSIETSQLLLLNGERGDDCISFCLVSSGPNEDHRVHAHTIDPYSINGFKPDITESHFQLSAGSKTLFTVTSARKFKIFLERCGHQDLLETIHNSNSLRLNPQSHQATKSKLAWHLSHPIVNTQQRSLHTAHLYTLILETLTQENKMNFDRFNLTPRQRIAQELVSWGFENSTNPIKLDDLANIFFSSRRTIIQGCKENFDVGPMELLRLIRLEQVNKTLRSNEIRESLELKKVGDVASHFGFTSRGHFSAAYQNQYGETPRQTLLKTNNQTLA